MPLYAFIYILLYFSFILKIVICTYLYYLIAYYIIVYCLSYAKSKLYMLYLSHTRAGVRAVGRFRGVFLIFGAFSGVRAGSIRYSVVLWIVGGRWGRFACVFVRVFPCVRACGGVPLPFFARAQPQRVYPLIVYGEYAGEYRVGGVSASASECVYCLIFSA